MSAKILKYPMTSTKQQRLSEKSTAVEFEWNEDYYSSRNANRWITSTELEFSRILKESIAEALAQALLEGIDLFGFDI